MKNSVTTVGIDVAKNVFQIHGNDASGKQLFSKRLQRKEVLAFMAQLPECLVGMEACGGSHWWGRQLKALKHTVRLMPPQHVKPYVKSQKNDRNDAAAIAEAVTRPSMRFVAIKMVEQQDTLSVHRVRSLLMKQRTALMNQIRGLLMEYGIVIPKGEKELCEGLAEVLGDAENELTGVMRALLDDQLEQWREIEQHLEKWDRQLHQIYTNNEVCQRLGKIEGIGPITATAIVATVGDASVFKNGREMSAWLGLVPRQNSSGGKTRMGGISKRGDVYVRGLLIHGARAVVSRLGKKEHARARWIRDKRERRGFNKACVALANKNARIIWALMRHGTEYRVSK
jgi:transposase